MEAPQNNSLYLEGVKILNSMERLLLLFKIINTINRLNKLNFNIKNKNL
ncbi:hypothetical protein [Tanapox virus]|uniref:Uncharacterized protein 28L n=1 Tax=Tanapox virus TaxID=99000 RepID=A7XCD8_9POXV|nr:hypothetical protein [Tanapox virus]ABQ43656.1 hypothetical protein [Tanapox virus]